MLRELAHAINFRILTSPFAQFACLLRDAFGQNAVRFVERVGCLGDVGHGKSVGAAAAFRTETRVAV
jgi:hypothetical protein